MSWTGGHTVLLIVVVLAAYYVGRNYPLGLPVLG